MKIGLRRWSLLGITLFGFLVGRYDLFQSAVNPLSIVKSTGHYRDPYLDYETFRKLMELYYGDKRDLDITVKAGEAGLFLYKDADYLYVESHGRLTVWDSVLHNVLPWIFSQKLRDCGVKVDPQTARVMNRMLNKWEGFGIVGKKREELVERIPQGYSMYDFTGEYGDSLRIIMIPRKGEELFYALVYLDISLRETTLVFDMVKGYFGVSSNVCELVQGDAPECLRGISWSTIGEAPGGGSGGAKEDNDGEGDSHE